MAVNEEYVTATVVNEEYVTAVITKNDNAGAMIEMSDTHTTIVSEMEEVISEILTTTGVIWIVGTD